MKLSKNCLLVFLTAALVALSVAGCQTLDPYTGQSQTSNATKGGLIGAGSGAVLAAVLAHGDKKKAALIGAGVGALVGTGVGYYMDKQEKELRDELTGTGVQVKRQGDNITLIMPGNITFAVDGSNLDPSFHSVLDSVAKVVKHYEKTVLVVAGYTDNTGAANYNEMLSKLRAQSVADYLVSDGVKAQRLATQGFGERYPVATNTTKAGRQQNRRVTLTLEPLTQSK